MTNKNIEDIIKMRMAVYKAGIKAGFWTDIDQSGASAMMDYLFPKSGQIAYYNLILEFMRKEHAMLTGGMYTLFKMPVQTEKEIVDYLRKEEIHLEQFATDSDEYLKSMDTIATDHSLTAVRIGAFNGNEIDSLLRLCASHYTFAFQSNVKSYPYFD